MYLAAFRRNTSVRLADPRPVDHGAIDCLAMRRAEGHSVSIFASREIDSSFTLAVEYDSNKEIMRCIWLEDWHSLPEPAWESLRGGRWTLSHEDNLYRADVRCGDRSLEGSYGERGISIAVEPAAIGARGLCTDTLSGVTSRRMRHGK